MRMAVKAGVLNKTGSLVGQLVGWNHGANVNLALTDRRDSRLGRSQLEDRSE